MLIYIHTYICTCIHIHANIHIYTHTCIHTYTHTKVHAYVHTYMPAYIHTYVCFCIAGDVSLLDVTCRVLLRDIMERSLPMVRPDVESPFPCRESRTQHHRGESFHGLSPSVQTFS